MTKEKKEKTKNSEDKIADIVKTRLVKLVENVRKKMNREDLIGVAELPVSATPTFLKTGSKYLDWALGGGIPLGRIIEVFSSKESEGKSSLCLSILKEVQKNGGIGVLIDTEQGNIGTRMESFGIDEDKLIFGTPDTMEEVFALLDGLLDEWDDESFGVIVWDSITATPTQEQVESDFGDKLYSPQAKVVSQSLLRIVKKLANKNVSLVITNQTRTKIGTAYGDPLDTTCGKALKFYASQRIKLSVKEVVYKSGELTPVGVWLKANVVKNKVARPFRVATIYLDFMSGFDFYEETIEYGKALKIIKEEKGLYTISGKEGNKMRKNTLIEYLKNDDVLVEEIWKSGSE